MHVTAQFYRDSRTRVHSDTLRLTVNDHAPRIAWIGSQPFDFWHMHWTGIEWEAWYIARGAI